MKSENLHDFLWDDHGLLFLTTRKKQNWKKTFKISVMQFCIENNQKKTLKKQNISKFDKIKGKINGQKRWKLFKKRLGNHQKCSVALKTGDSKLYNFEISTENWDRTGGLYTSPPWISEKQKKMPDAFKSELKRQTSSLRMSFNTLSSDLKTSGIFCFRNS